jgi:hypothetical protein
MVPLDVDAAAEVAAAEFMLTTSENENLVKHSHIDFNAHQRQVQSN